MAKYFLSWAPLASASCLITSKVGCLVLELSTKLLRSMFPVGDRVGDHWIFVALILFRFGEENLPVLQHIPKDSASHNSLKGGGRECLTRSDEYVPIQRMDLALGAGLHQFPRVQQARVHVQDKQQPSSPTRWSCMVSTLEQHGHSLQSSFPQPCVPFNFEGHNSVMPLVKSI